MDDDAPPMVTTTEKYLWGIVMVVIVALSVPWFLWRSDAVAYGLPVWLWWHVCWMLLAAMTFRVFARRAWGVGIEEGV